MKVRAAADRRGVAVQSSPHNAGASLKDSCRARGGRGFGGLPPHNAGASLKDQPRRQDVLLPGVVFPRTMRGPH